MLSYIIALSFLPPIMLYLLFTRIIINPALTFSKKPLLPIDARERLQSILHCKDSRQEASTSSARFCFLWTPALKLL
jgi:hypothetical protein